MFIRNVSEADWQFIYEIECDNFSKEEAASIEAIRQRTSLIKDTFLVAEINQKIVGYIEGPVVLEPHLEDSLFHQIKENPASGGYIAVTSLSIAKDYQQQGIGMALIAALKDLSLAQKRQGIILTCHDYLIPYYQMNGFTCLGLSDSKHGGSVWYDMLWKNKKQL
ncbi:GNAT family N-acetyltransferase [Streptococcus didelphis]|uniref:GNAT family N-acetyltransferase n=1 Tax=Streptococcus didelphis TaxID=102886 RepID=A0ABY9LKG0_9STRE|nr:GNAT family N-acetyltransferase [Streptococcus didelphis]WMB28571.1 GNAT family N-acetyltransferase [Streptococcus didelphis]WMB29244.1 GNAT family N-acetyltransferase [Streptococcus didelphis]